MNQQIVTDTEHAATPWVGRIRIEHDGITKADAIVTHEDLVVLGRALQRAETRLTFDELKRAGEWLLNVRVNIALWELLERGEAGLRWDDEHQDYVYTLDADLLEIRGGVEQ